MPDALSHDDGHRGRITSRRDLSRGLMVIRVVAGRAFPFEPGQYATLGLPGAGGRLVQRPMSIASSADDVSDYEFVIRLVPGGEFTPLLWHCAVGDSIHITGAKGRFVLQDDGRTCVFVASGTGLAPFVSMIRTLRSRAETRDIVLMHGVSRDDDLVWRDELEAPAAGGALPLRYLPTVSRPQECPTWTGATGRVEAIFAGQLDRFALGPGNATVYACGNPEMTDAVIQIARARGFGPDQIRQELYWRDDHGR